MALEERSLELAQLEEEYEAYLDMRVDKPEGETTPDGPKAPFQITSSGQVGWALRKIRKVNEKVEAVHQMADERIAAVENFRTLELDKLQREREYFEGLLLAYHQPLYLEDPKGNKSLSFPEGRLTWKKRQPEFIREEDKLLPWAKANRPDVVKTKESVDWAGLKKQCQPLPDGRVVTTDGELVEGVRAEFRADKFEVQVC